MDRAWAHAGQESHTTWSSVAILLAGRRDQPAGKLPQRCARTRTISPIVRCRGAPADPSVRRQRRGRVRWSRSGHVHRLVGRGDGPLCAHRGAGRSWRTHRPRAEATLLRHAGHPDARVRRAVAQGFISDWRSSPPTFSGDTRTALLRLMTDPDQWYGRRPATVAGGRDNDPAFAEAMAAALDDTDRLVQLAPGARRRRPRPARPARSGRTPPGARNLPLGGLRRRAAEAPDTPPPARPGAALRHAGLHSPRFRWSRSGGTPLTGLTEQSLP